MKILLNIALQSLLSRKVTVFLTIISLTISIVLFLSIDTFDQLEKFFKKIFVTTYWIDL